MDSEGKFNSILVHAMSFCVAVSIVVSPAVAEDDRQIVKFPDAGGVQLGTGVSAFSLAPTTRFCINGAVIEYKTNTNDLVFRKLIDNSSLSDVLRVSAQAKVSGISGSGQGSATYVRELKISETDTNVGATGYVTTKQVSVVPRQSGLPSLRSAESAPIVEIEDGASLATLSGAGFAEVDDTSIRLTRDARRLLQREGGVSLFRQQCGDYFVASVTYGGAFDAVLTARDTSREEKEAFSGNLSGNFSFGEFSVSTDRTIQKLRQTNRIEVRVRSQGSGLTTNPLTIGEFETFVRNFPLSVVAGERPIEIVLQSYRSLPDFPQEYAPKLDVLDRMADQFLRLQFLRNNLDEMVAQEADFAFRGPVSPASIRSLADEISGEMGVLRSAISACQSQIDSCVYPDIVASDDYEFRLRMPMAKTAWRWDDTLMRASNELQAAREKLASTSRTRQVSPAFRLMIPNPAYVRIEEKVNAANACVTQLAPMIGAIYVRDRVNFWVRDPWVERSRFNDEDRAALSYSAIAEMTDTQMRAAGANPESIAPITKCDGF